ncbi:hypothetical protein GFS60_05907 [Rhodococcus sp. WAY2]|nr:hypothetical protein GFS60_05907 [Rhodococcus sp. WAY2]
MPILPVIGPHRRAPSRSAPGRAPERSVRAVPGPREGSARAVCEPREGSARTIPEPREGSTRTVCGGPVA